ncbi:flagellar basal body P-ring formation chaperone FlgA [Atopomonas sediminilitoris]|uniref:flagellar basal body P-ring formation chaperone FlgA n=1 Tax=Atopomonas sediminilitoris TaxID=2919919 RepID=UPI001F4E9D7B|nr:flagellar basal body P-ring formation chaperone FlgA [Atopomonas sediminilitoris]MCJ8167778.1 flagellar basal body P-ring formation protein FlgA [Atopomonas sediminilitoris]
MRPLLLFICLSLTPYPLWAAALSEQIIGQAHAFLEEHVATYIEAQADNPRADIQPIRVDPRLRLADCDKPLTIQQESQGSPIGRVTLSVRCSGSSPWRIFIPAEVHLYRAVVIMARPMARKSKVQPEDLVLRETEVSAVRQNYLTDLNQAAGQTLRRPVGINEILTTSHLEPSKLIRRGDRVVILATNGDFIVKMQGEALSDGAKGQQIRVRNVASGRIIRARVTGPNQVKVAI